MKSRLICNQHNYAAQSHGLCLGNEVMDQKRGQWRYVTDGNMLQAVVCLFTGAPEIRQKE